MKRRQVSLLSLLGLSKLWGLSSIVTASDDDHPEIVAISLEPIERETGETDLEFTVRVASETPVAYLSRRFLGPEGPILGGGRGVAFDEVADGIWEYAEVNTVSKWAPDGEYSYEDVRVRNEADRESPVWPEDVQTTIETGYEANPPELIDVSLETIDRTDGQLDLELTVVAESNAPVDYIRRRFVGPEGPILGGGRGVTFTEIGEGRWEYVDTNTLSKWAPDGTYAHEEISVRNEGQLESEVWAEDVQTTIETEYEADPPELLDVTLETTERTDGDTELELTVIAASNAPVDYLRRRFVGPERTILGGGRGVTFQEVDDGVWAYSDSNVVSQHAPDGEYAYETIRVRNEGQLESDTWPEEVSTTIEQDAGDDETEEVDCFIATAACGTPDHDAVQTLRAFRDERLHGTYPGELFIHTYYTVSPPIATWIAKGTYRRKAVRALVVRPAARIATVLDT